MLALSLAPLVRILSLALPLHYRIHPKELAVLVPALHEPAEVPTAAPPVKPR